MENCTNSSKPSKQARKSKAIAGNQQPTALQIQTENYRGYFLYPLEVEAYYNDGDQFEDSSCHCHALQYDRFGKLYFHRLGATDTIDKNRGGTDLCLSTRNGLCYSILIRSAKINDQVIIGPHRVAKKYLTSPQHPTQN